MFSRKYLLLLFILLASQSFSQTGLSIRFGSSPWHFVDKFEDLSNPISLSYSGGLNVEQIIGNSSVGILTGIEYLHAQPGTKYVDLSDQLNPVAVIYEKEMNERYINVTHHELTVPFMFVFYYNGLRTGIGASYSQYLFDNQINGYGFEKISDYGIRVSTGARLSKRLIFSIGYYYGLKNVIELNLAPNQDIEGPMLSANMQQIKVHLSISLFNNFDDSKYFVSQ